MHTPPFLPIFGQNMSFFYLLLAFVTTPKRKAYCPHSNNHSIEKDEEPDLVFASEYGIVGLLFVSRCSLLSNLKNLRPLFSRTVADNFRIHLQEPTLDGRIAAGAAMALRQQQQFFIFSQILSDILRTAVSQDVILHVFIGQALVYLLVVFRMP